eukprot:gene8294-5790_t
MAAALQQALGMGMDGGSAAAATAGAAVPLQPAAGPAAGGIVEGHSRKPEHRIDPSDDKAYPLRDYVAVYGGSLDAPPSQWFAAKP